MSLENNKRAKSNIFIKLNLAMGKAMPQLSKHLKNSNINEITDKD